MWSSLKERRRNNRTNLREWSNRKNLHETKVLRENHEATERIFVSEVTKRIFTKRKFFEEVTKQQNESSWVKQQNESSRNDSIADLLVRSQLTRESARMNKFSLWERWMYFTWRLTQVLREDHEATERIFVSEATERIFTKRLNCKSSCSES